ncbi:MAG: hypothetical protein LBJ77_00075 [Holosporales bacterium]|jgi:hypothetical protein|nr:hypothetical protein [Holosporales bacterium]
MSSTNQALSSEPKVGDPQTIEPRDAELPQRDLAVGDPLLGARQVTAETSPTPNTDNAVPNTPPPAPPPQPAAAPAPVVHDQQTKSANVGDKAGGVLPAMSDAELFENYRGAVFKVFNRSMTLPQPFPSESGGVLLYIYVNENVLSMFQVNDNEGFANALTVSTEQLDSETLKTICRAMRQKLIEALERMNASQKEAVTVSLQGVNAGGIAPKKGSLEEGVFEIFEVDQGQTPAKPQPTVVIIELNPGNTSKVVTTPSVEILEIAHEHDKKRRKLIEALTQSLASLSNFSVPQAKAAIQIARLRALIRDNEKAITERLGDQAKVFKVTAEHLDKINTKIEDQKKKVEQGKTTGANKQTNAGGKNNKVSTATQKQQKEAEDNLLNLMAERASLEAQLKDLRDKRQEKVGELEQKMEELKAQEAKLRSSELGDNGEVLLVLAEQSYPSILSITKDMQDNSTEKRAELRSLVVVEDAN